MIRIIHLSDPHFGTEPECLPAVLLGCIETLGADAIVLSGDLTQRATPRQFRAARRFIASLPAPVLVIPGNHDVPLWNLPLRAIDPWRRWRLHLGLPLEGHLELPGVSIIGLNSANPKVWKDGRVTGAQISRIERQIAASGPRRVIVALHHPPQPPSGEPPSLARADELVGVCRASGVEMILSGHLHFSHVAPVVGASGILAVQTGTCLSERQRGDGRAFSVIDLHVEGATVVHHRLEADGLFKPDAARDWRRGTEGWH